MKSINQKTNPRLAFIQEFVKNPLEVGSIIPSSRYLERRILKAAEVGTAKTLVELGPGTGGTTKAILGAMSKEAKLLSIEINPRLHKIISRIEDPRLIPHLGSAFWLEEIISQYNLSRPDSIISGIPFSTLSHQDGEMIIKAISQVLANNGCFVAYQVRGRVADLCRPLLGKGQVLTEFRNLPPLRVFRWKKNGQGEFTRDEV